MILAVAANNAFGYQGKRYAIGCLDSCKRILVVRARVFIMYGVSGIHFLASTTSSYLCPLKIGGEIPSKRNILYDIIMRRDLEKVDVALLQSSFE